METSFLRTHPADLQLKARLKRPQRRHISDSFPSGGEHEKEEQKDCKYRGAANPTVPHFAQNAVWRLPARQQRHYSRRRLLTKKKSHVAPNT
jgi:hypothetical protein